MDQDIYKTKQSRGLMEDDETSETGNEARKHEIEEKSVVGDSGIFHVSKKFHDLSIVTSFFKTVCWCVSYTTFLNIPYHTKYCTLIKKKRMT
jgi:hypothetical protein